MKSFEKEHPSASSSLLPDEQRQQSVDAAAAAVTTSTWCAVVRLAILLLHRVNDVSTSALVYRPSCDGAETHAGRARTESRNCSRNQRIVSLGYAAAGPALRWSASRRQQLKHEIPRFSALNLMTLVRIRLSRGKYYRHRNSVLSYHFNVYISGITH